MILPGTNKFDVWLTEDGQAAICESEDNTEDGYILNCGKKAGGLCWEWDICSAQVDLFGDIGYEEDLEELAEADSWLSWYGGWGSFAMGSDPLKDSIVYPDYTSDTDAIITECEECD